MWEMAACGYKCGRGGPDCGAQKYFFPDKKFIQFYIKQG